MPWKNPLLTATLGEYGNWFLDLESVLPPAFQNGGHGAEPMVLGGHIFNHLVGDGRFRANTTYFRDHTLLEWMVRDFGTVEPLDPHVVRSLNAKWQSLSQVERERIAGNGKAAAMDKHSARRLIKDGIRDAKREVEIVGAELRSWARTWDACGQPNHAVDWILSTLAPYFPECQPSWVPSSA